MSSKSLKSVTLIELIIAIILLAVIVLGINNISVFSRYQIISSDKRAKVQNEVSLALEHMTKQISKAIGNETVNGSNTVVQLLPNPNPDRIMVYIDADGNGIREDPPSFPAVGPDYWIAYRFQPTINFYKVLRYCPKCTNNPCTTCDPAWSDASSIVSQYIRTFNITNAKPGGDTLSDNRVEIELTGCYDPYGTTACGTPDNPSVTMSTSISLPSVSTN